MKYLNVQLLGLSGRPHPVIQHIQTTQDSKKLRLHLKFLTCDLYNYSTGVNQPCPHCNLPVTDQNEHALVSCQAFSDIRGRIFPELMNTVLQVPPTSQILLYNIEPTVMTQFILDCASPNLPGSIHVPVHNPRISEIYRVSRDWCYVIGREKCRLLKAARLQY